MHIQAQFPKRWVCFEFYTSAYTHVLFAGENGDTLLTYSSRANILFGRRAMSCLLRVQLITCMHKFSVFIIHIISYAHMQIHKYLYAVI
jgi:hypothetical protein